MRGSGWNDCPPKREILAFLVRVTTEGSADFVPAPERIAVFDNDGTLWPENPMPFQAAYALDELKFRASTEPELAEHPMVEAALAGDIAKLLAGDNYEGLGLLVHHTDGEREYAYDAVTKSTGKLVEALKEAPARGWHVVDMERDWNTVFGSS